MVELGWAERLLGAAAVRSGHSVYPSRHHGQEVFVALVIPAQVVIATILFEQVVLQGTARQAAWVRAQAAGVGTWDM